MTTFFINSFPFRPRVRVEGCVIVVSPAILTALAGGKLNKLNKNHSNGVFLLNFKYNLNNFPCEARLKAASLNDDTLLALALPGVA